MLKRSRVWLASAEMCVALPVPAEPSFPEEEFYPVGEQTVVVPPVLLLALPEQNPALWEPRR